MIVTANLRDFPDSEFAQFGVEAKHPDEFVMDLFNLDGVGFIRRSVRRRRGGVILRGCRRMCVIVWWRRVFRFQRRRFAAEIGSDCESLGLLATLRTCPLQGTITDGRHADFVDTSRVPGFAGSMSIAAGVAAVRAGPSAAVVDSGRRVR